MRLEKWFMAALLVAVACSGTACESAPAKGSGAARQGGEGAVARRPEGEKPDVDSKKLDPRGLDMRWQPIYLGEKIDRIWVLDDSLYVFTKKQNLYCLGLDDGSVHWEYSVKDDISFAPCVYNYRNDTGILRKNELFLISKDVLHCIDKDAGYCMWKKVLPFAASSAPAASSTHVYVGSWDHRVYALEKESRHVGWSYRTRRPVTARPESSEKLVDSVFVGSEDGGVYSLNPVQEERKWVFGAYGPISAPPLFFRNYVYVGSLDFSVYCVSALNGSLEWRYPTGGPILKAPVAYTRETVYVVSGESNLLALNLQPDVKKQYVRWSYDRGVQVLAKGRRDVYVLDSDGNVVSLADESGKPRWASPLETGADFFATNPFDPTSHVEREKRLAATIVLGYRDGWLMAVREKAEY